MTDTAPGTETATTIPPRPADHLGHTLKHWPTDALRDELAKHDEIGYVRIAEELAWREKYAAISPEAIDAMPERDDVDYFDALRFIEGVAELLQDDDDPDHIAFHKDYFPNGSAFLRHRTNMLVVTAIGSGSQIRYAKRVGTPVSVLELTPTTPVSVVADVAQTIAQTLETPHR